MFLLLPFYNSHKLWICHRTSHQSQPFVVYSSSSWWIAMWTWHRQLQFPPPVQVDVSITPRLGSCRGKVILWSFTRHGAGLVRSSHTRLGTHSGNASTHLLPLWQNARSMVEHFVDFWTLAADTTWNEPALQGVFLQGLCSAGQVRHPWSTLRSRMPRGRTLSSPHLWECWDLAACTVLSSLFLRHTCPGKPHLPSSRPACIGRTDAAGTCQINVWLTPPLELRRWVLIHWTRVQYQCTDKPGHWTRCILTFRATSVTTSLMARWFSLSKLLMCWEQLAGRGTHCPVWLFSGTSPYTNHCHCSGREDHCL